MKRAEKESIMSMADYDINMAKDMMNRAVQTLEENGLFKDADTLFRMILKLEMFQNKYNECRL